MKTTNSNWWLAVPMIALLALPVIALLVSSSPSELADGVRSPLFAPSLLLSLKTASVSLLIIVVGGTPVAWWLGSNPKRKTRWIEWIVDTPIVLPPAVVGIALLTLFGRNGWAGALGLQIPFTTFAVVIAQTVVAAPFYIQSASSAFREIDPEYLLVARTLGHDRRSTFFRIVLPLARPGLIAGAALAFARALGEFGATLIFAGNFPGVTQTMPLAIYATLESNVQAATAMALILAAISVGILFVIRQFQSAPGSRR